MNFKADLINILVFFLASGTSFQVWNIADRHYRKYMLAKRFNFKDQPGSLKEPRSFSPSFNRLALSLGRLAVPKDTEAVSEVSGRLSYAGFRQEAGVIVFYGIKLGLGLVLAIVFVMAWLGLWHFSSSACIMIFLPFGLGYIFPDIVLKHMADSRIRKIFLELPDTLDLLEICLRAGMGFDYALFRVCSELGEIAPVLSDEFGRYFFEIRTGLGRQAALMNLGERNGSEPLKQVINVILQSFKIGSDMAQALKIYTDTMRRERQQTAEEQGAKLATKLTLPLVVFILPALMLVILGPVIMNFIGLVHNGL